MKKRFAALFVFIGIAWGSVAAVQAFDITAEVTSDNFYAFGWGNVNGILQPNYWPEASTTPPLLSVDNSGSPGDIYNCPTTVTPRVNFMPSIGAEIYPNIKPTITDYLYVVAFSDWKHWQGTLGTFLDNNSGQLIGSGSAGWQVFATGVSTKANSTPTLAEVNDQIALANGSLGNSATSSVGWVGPSGGSGGTVGHLVTVSQANAPWPQVCGMDPVASWMWYQDDLDPSGPAFDAFKDQPTSPGKRREFLIFRLPVRTFESALLKVCKVAGPGVEVGTPFTFTAGGTTFSVPAGPEPGGTCVIGPRVPVDSTVAVVETIPPGVTVSNITVLPTGQVTGGPNLAAGSVNIALGSGVTEVTFTNKRTGYLEICKNSAEGVEGDFSFTVNPGSLGPIVVAAGTCSPAIEVDAGEVLISEQQIDGYVMADCSTFPASQQGACNLEDLTSIVTVAPGDVSTQTVVFITNRRRK